MNVSITVISDTHLRHTEIVLPGGDLLIHCGDMMNLSTRGKLALRDLDDWFGRQGYDKVFCVGGNHDHVLQDVIGEGQKPFKNAIYLQDEQFRYQGLNIYGSPWVPNLPFHAFHKNDAALAEAWTRIPSDTDILITHTPPRGMLDKSSKGHSHGCRLLAKEIKRIAPKVHCFGHVHASAGSQTKDGTLFVNASSIESGNGLMLPPITFTIARDDQNDPFVSHRKG